MPIARNAASPKAVPRLLTTPPAVTMPYQRIAILENLIEAQLLSAALDDRGIGHRIRSYHDTAYDGLFQFQKGWGDIQASETDGPEVLRALADIRSSATP